MNLKYGIILSAGFGSRMNGLSDFIPKPLLPLYDSTLLDLQISILKKMGIKEIFINTHHKADLIQEHIKEKYDKSVICIHEQDLLGSGGGITNIVKQYSSQDNTDDYVYIVNSDAFTNISNSQLESIFSKLQNVDKLLLAIPNNKIEYNQFVIENNLLKQVIAPVKNKEYFTYSGSGFFKISSIRKSSLYSNFFESVADYANEKVGVFRLDPNQHFDYGTFELYVDNILNISKYKELNLFMSEHTTNHRKFEIFPKVFDFSGNMIINRDLISEEEIIILKSDILPKSFDKKGVYYLDHCFS